MLAAASRTAALFGVEACPVHVEVDVSFGLPSFTMVGLPDASVRESRDRVRQRDPQLRLRVPAAPDHGQPGAGRRAKSRARRSTCPSRSASWPHPGVVERRHVADLVLLGENSRSMDPFRRLRGVLPIAAAAQRDGLAGILLPASNAGEAADRRRSRRVRRGVARRRRAARSNEPSPTRTRTAADPPSAHRRGPDLADVRGQLLARARARNRRGGRTQPPCSSARRAPARR